jgi:hypothetical protein
MDATELTRGKLISAACGLALFVLMFFSWFDYGQDFSAAATAAGLDTTYNAWQAFGFIDIVLFLTAIAAVGAVVLGVISRGPAPVAPEAVVFLLGVLSSLLVLYRILNPVLDAGRELGLFLGFLASAGIAAGGWMAMQEAAAARRPRRRERPQPPSAAF